MKIFIKIFLCFIVLMSCKKEDVSQDSGPNVGKIKGYVLDDDLDGSDKTIMFYKSNDTTKKQLSKDGNFLFENVPVGSYTIMVKGIGDTQRQIEVRKKTRTGIYFSFNLVGWMKWPDGFGGYYNVPIQRWESVGPEYIEE